MKKKDDSFAEQFADVKKLDGTEYIDIQPEKESEKTPVILAPGWTRDMNTIPESLKVLHEENRRVISLNHPRIAGDITGGKLNEKQDLYSMPKEILRRAESLRKLIDQTAKDTEEKKVSIIGQSMGGMDAVVAAIMAENENPGTIKSIVLIDPAGIMGKDSLFGSSGLAQRFVKDQIPENIAVMKSTTESAEAIQNQRVAGKQFFKYLAKNPLRAIKEVKAMTSVQIQDILIELQNRGIGVSIIHGVDDKTFPMKNVQKNVRGEHATGFYSVKGRHNELFMHPEQYMDLAEEALSDLEKKQTINKPNVRKK
ncbi:MAG: alpha/beta hydrolase [bacterium]|nr:alpha/beta hydrolase [bacterium]